MSGGHLPVTWLFRRKASPTGGATKKPNAVALGFFERCVPQAERDVSFRSDLRFAREVCLGA